MAVYAKEFVDAFKHHMPHLLQRRKHTSFTWYKCMNEFGPSSAFNAELYVCLRLVYYRKHNCIGLSVFNSKLRALWETGNFQAMT